MPRKLSEGIIARTDALGAHNYAPLPAVLCRAEGVWAWDVDGTRYLDMLGAYSALNHGHRHPRLVAALQAQLGRLTLTSRAFHNDKLVEMYERLVALTALDTVLPMNTGVEAVETALKVARKWGYRVKGVAPERAEIVVCRNNFHGRTISVISFSSDANQRADFGPYTPGFVSVDFGSVGAVEQVINDNTVAVLLEPIQGEGGVIIPPDGYLEGVEQLCREHDVLLMLDEIQTGLGRTGRMFCYEHDNVRPDVVMVGKALGGGLLPVSAVVGRKDVMGVLRPGQHGSTFGGNPLAAAVAVEALDVLRDEGLVDRAAQLGRHLMGQLTQLRSPHIAQIRGRGLLVGIEFHPRAGGARRFCERLAGQGLLCKDAHEHVLRLSPPLVIERETLDWAVAQLQIAFG